MRGQQDRAARASRRRRATSCRRSGSPPGPAGRCRWRWPSSFSRVSSAAGDSVSPSIATGSPRSKSMVTYVGLVRRVLRRDGALIDESGASSAGSSSTFPSDDECSRLASTLNGASPRLSLAIGIWCCSANSSRPGAAGEVPLAPGRDHLDVGLQRVVAELEAHLVVALAGRAMGDRVGADLARRSRSGSWRSAAGRSRCRAGTGPRRARWRGTSGRRSRARIPRAGRR